MKRFKSFGIAAFIVAIGFVVVSCPSGSDGPTWEHDCSHVGHNWGNWVQTLAPTATTPGEEARSCQRCGTVETRPIPPLGHDCSHVGHSWSNWVQTLAPTATTPGEETRSCQHCGTVETRPIPPLGHDCDSAGHNWSDWIETTAPTYTTAGEETRTCAWCGHIETRPIPPLSVSTGNFEISFATLQNMAPDQDITTWMSILYQLPITVTDAGAATIRWLVGDNEIGRGASITLNHDNFHGNEIGTHFLTLIAEVGGREYSNRIAIDVRP